MSILTDTYASRPWCRREILNAKLGGVPLQVINALSNGEPRSFPYIGSVPTQRWRADDPYRFENALGALLIRGANLAYGGDHRDGGFTSILFDLISTYDQPGQDASDTRMRRSTTMRCASASHRPASRVFETASMRTRTESCSKPTTSTK